MKKLIFHGNAIVTGRNSIEFLKNENFNKVFIVTGGKSMFKNGTIDKITKIFEDKGSEVFVHAGVSKNPDTESVISGLEDMNKFKPDVVIAAGGGSPIDAAKVMTLFYEYPKINFGNVFDISIPKKRKNTAFIAIPSTSGTGTEVTQVSVITFREKSLKLAIKAESLIPDLAILDPAITMSMPDNIAAETGMDALTHAVECYTNNNLDDFTESIAKGAIEGLIKYLPLSYKNKDIESREKVHNFQCMAGCAFANVGLGMVHGISHAFGGRYNLGHGLTNAIVLPYVLQYNSRNTLVSDKLKYLSKVIGSKDIIDEIKNLKKVLNIPVSIKEAGINKETFERDIELLVSNSMLGSTKVNPVSISKGEMKKMLIHIYEGKDIEV